MKENREIEIKLQIKNNCEADNLTSWLQSIAGKNLQKIKMKAIYYDTKDGFFNKHKIAYRIRQENKNIVATYKSGTVNKNGVFERIEINKTVENVEPDITVFADERLIWEVVKSVENVDLEPIVITDFMRQCTVLKWNDAQIEVALDRGEVWGKNNKSSICELELELKEGSEEDLLGLKKMLMQKFSLESSTVSKYKKGLILAGL